MDPQIVALLGALKGPPANILLALVTSDKPLGTKELVHLTGWCEASVNSGLHRLELLGWVERLARYNGWSLVRQVRLSVIPKIFSVEESDISLDPDLAGNHENLGSLPPREPGEVQVLIEPHENLGSLHPGEPGEVQVLVETPTKQGSIAHEQTHPVHLLNGNREFYGSDLPPGSLQVLIDRANHEFYCSPALSAPGFYGRRYPLRKKHPANIKIFGSLPEEESLEEVNLRLKDLTLSSSDSDSAPPPENGPPGRLDQPLSSANVGEILAATRRLFGERVMGTTENYPDPVRLLAAIAEAYEKRQKLRKPARVVFANLRNETNISAEYLDDPLSFLPKSFLKEAGLPQVSSKKVNSRYLEGIPDYDAGEEAESPDPPMLSDPGPSLSLAVSENSARTAAEAWSMANSILVSQLDPDIFLKYLADSALVRYDFPSNTFTVAVVDPYTRDWLTERLTRLVGRLLVGITGRESTVIFETDEQVVEGQ